MIIVLKNGRLVNFHNFYKLSHQYLDVSECEFQVTLPVWDPVYIAQVDSPTITLWYTLLCLPQASSLENRQSLEFCPSCATEWENGEKNKKYVLTPTVTLLTHANG